MLRFSFTIFLLFMFSLPSFSQTGPLRLWGVVSSDDSPGNEHPGNGFVYSVKADGTDFAIVKNFLPNPDGGVPRGKLLQRANGEFFGTTYVGGVNDWGALYKLSSDGSVYTKLFDFSKATGGLPTGSLVESVDGRLFGLTRQGSTSNHGGIFSILPDGSGFQKHHEFSSFEAPYAPLLLASDGNYYGTLARGPSQAGILYKLDGLTLTVTDLYTFNFWDFNGPLLEGQDGKIYGAGNLQNGTLVVFRINKDGSAYETVHTFGFYGDVSLLQLPAGKLVGATTVGGQSNSGQLFSMDPDGSNYTELFDFSGVATYPGSLILSSNGKLYGMGSNNGYGMVYEINAGGTNFNAVSNGGFSNGTPTRNNGIIESADGSLYITASTNGASHLGTIGKLTKAGVFTKLKEFVQEGSDPDGGLTLASNGKLYGGTSSGGPDGWGTLFSIEKNGTGFSTLFNFDGINGRTPVGRLVEMPDGFLYGVTRNGGNQLSGNLFKIDLDGNNFSTIKDFEFSQGNPSGSLIKGQDGFLYGVTGSNNSNIKGILFKLLPNGTGFNVVVDFAQHESLVGTQPVGITQIATGEIVGVTSFGGANFSGTVFKVATDGGNLVKLKNLDTDSFVLGSRNVPIEASNGKLYGTGFFNRAIYALGADGGGASTFSSAQFFQSFGKLVELDNSLYAATVGQLIRFNLANNAFTHFNWGLNGYDNMVLLPKGGLIVVDDRQSQTITFDPIPSKAFGSGQIKLVSTTTSGLTVQFTSSNASVATVEGNKVTIVGVGQTVLSAMQPGDENYKHAETKTQTLTVTKANQVIKLFPDAVSPRNAGEEPFDANAFASSGLPVSYVSSNQSVATVEGSLIRPIAMGETTITVSQGGDANFNPAPSMNFTLKVRPRSPYSFLRKFGKYEEDLNFSFPRGMATDADGNVYVACSQENKVKKFTSDGQFIQTIGNRGGSNGMFNSPYDVDILGDEIFVLDRLNGRVQVFSTSGTFKRRFGSLGAGAGQFQGAVGLAVSPDGNVYVSDAGNNRIVVFNIDGRFLFSFGSFGSQLGQFANLGVLAVDASGNLYVLDRGNYRVQVFNSDGVFVRKIGSQGTNDGEFFLFPIAFTLLDNGELQLLTQKPDLGYGIERFAPTGLYLGRYSLLPNIESTYYAQPNYLHSDGDKIYVSDPFNYYIDLYQNGQFKKRFGEPTDRQLRSVVNGIAQDGSGNVYVSCPVNVNIGSVKVLDPSGSYLRSFGANGSVPQRLSDPGSLVIDDSGTSFVVDRSERSILVYDASGAFLRSSGSYGSGPGQFESPGGIALDATGKLYVPDFYHNRIQIFDTNGDYLSDFGSSGSGEGQFNFPTSVFFDQQGKIYVTDDSRTLVFDANGVFLFSVDGGGHMVRVSEDGRIFVLAYQHSVNVFDKFGVYLYNIGSYGSQGNGTLHNPSDFFIDDVTNQVFVSEFSGNIQVFGMPRLEVRQTNLISSGDTFDFGSKTVGSELQKVFAVKNTGSGQLKLGEAPVPFGAAANDFLVTDWNAGLILAPGAETNFNVTFKPTAAGVRIADLKVPTNVVSAGEFFFQLSGTASKNSQEITFNPLTNKTFNDSPFSLSATSSSGLPVIYSSSDETILSIESDMVTLHKPGVVNITANQPGNEFYQEASSVTQQLTVEKASQQITFGALSVKKYTDVPFELSASSSASLPVSYASSNPSVATVSDNQVTIHGAGTATITASQSGDTNYNAAIDVEQVLSVSKADQSISFEPILDKNLDDLSISLSAQASSNLNVQFTSDEKVLIDGSVATLLKAGRATIKASQPGNNNYEAAPEVEQSFCINPSRPTITTDNSNPGQPVLVSSGSENNQWYFNDAPVEGATEMTLAASKSGTYTVRTTVDDCVSQVSEGVVLLITGDVDNIPSHELLVFPNPVENTLSFFLKGDNAHALTFSIVDTVGGLVSSGVGEVNLRVDVKLSDVSAGVYVLSVETAMGVYRKIVVKK